MVATTAATGLVSLLSMVAARGLGLLICCQALSEEPASLDTHSLAHDGVIRLSKPSHLMADTS